MKRRSHPESRRRHPMLAAIVASTTVLLFGFDPTHAQEPDVKDVLQHDAGRDGACVSDADGVAGARRTAEPGRGQGGRKEGPRVAWGFCESPACRRLR